MLERILRATFIGYMYGIENAVGSASQVASNIAGRVVGREILKAYKESGFKGEVEEIPEMLSLFGNLSLKREDFGWLAEISDCKICPKRVGGYQFEGTACPWPGILVGMLEEITGERFNITTRLTPGEVCVVRIERKAED